jgi:hypothetical protein
MTPFGLVGSYNVSEEHVTSIFRVKLKRLRSTPLAPQISDKQDIGPDVKALSILHCAIRCYLPL